MGTYWNGNINKKCLQENFVHSQYACKAPYCMAVLKVLMLLYFYYITVT